MVSRETLGRGILGRDMECVCNKDMGRARESVISCLPSNLHLLVFTLLGNPLPLNVVGTVACFKQIELAKVMGWMSLLR